MKVELIKWSPGHSADLCHIYNNADRRYLSNRLPLPYTEADADWWLCYVTEREGKTGIFRAIIVDEEYVGGISIERKADVYEKDAELGYLLLDKFWSKGVMTEAVAAICDIAFRELDISRITGLVYSPNIASRRVLEKNGFTLEGQMKKAVSKDGIFYDLCVYGKLK